MTHPIQLNGATALPHLGIIHIQGPDAASFVHGQLTSDFFKLGLSQARLAGYCSAKGRMLASFIGWKQDAQSVSLLCSADLLERTQKRLTMFVLRAKCKLADASGSVQVMGLAGDSANVWLGHSAPAEPWHIASHGDATVIRLPDVHQHARYLWIAERSLSAPELPPLDLERWQWGEVQSGVARIEAATMDHFVPQMLNFELLGGVDFQKGCYPGQEIVARSQYRGTTKRRSFIFSCDAPAAPGQEIFHSEDPNQPAGMVVNAARQPTPLKGYSLLAEVKLSALESGHLHLAGMEGARLTPDAMPYAVLPEHTG